MKRLNPNTGLPFERNQIRHDGFIFAGYSKIKNQKGFFHENWMSPKSAENTRKSSAESAKRNRAKQSKEICSQRHKERMTSFRGRALTLIKSAKYRATKKGFNVDLDGDYIAEIIKKGRCQLTGLTFDLNPPGKYRRNPYAPSLDRIDSEKGYTEENIRIVILAVNDAINQYGDTIMLPILEAMVKGIKKNVKQAKLTQLPTKHHSESA